MAKKAKQREVVVVASKIKDAVKESGCQSSGDLVEAISEKVHEILDAAVERARQNGRATVRPYDL
jgi:histone H3/H4